MCALTLLTVQDILVSEVSNSIGNTLFENLFSVVIEKTAAGFFKTNTIYLQKMHLMQLKGRVSQFVLIFRHASVSSTYPCPLVSKSVSHTFGFPISGRTGDDAQ